MLDDVRHPDLVDLDHRLTIRLEAVLDAEQEAAAVSARRILTLRDRLILAENQNATATVWTRAGVVSGAVTAVCSDHIEVTQTTVTSLVPLDSILAVRL